MAILSQIVVILRVTSNAFGGCLNQLEVIKVNNDISQSLTLVVVIEDVV